MVIQTSVVDLPVTVLGPLRERPFLSPNVDGRALAPRVFLSSLVFAATTHASRGARNAWLDSLGRGLPPRVSRGLDPSEEA